MNERRDASVRSDRGVPGIPGKDVRVGPLAPIPRLLLERGLDPVQVFEQVGLDLHLFDDPENRVPHRVLGSLLENCVRLTGCRHFGLLVGQRFEMDSLGVLGRLMRNAPTVRDALREGVVNLAIHDRGAVSLTLSMGNAQSALGYSLVDGNIPAADQIIDGAIAMQLLLLRELCGPSWTPRAVRLSHGRPDDVAPLRVYFGVRIEYDADYSAILFDSCWLDHPIDGADPEIHHALLEAIASQASDRPPSFAARVRRALYALTFTESPSTTGLARLFDVNERTLRRRLEAEGATVRELVGEVRRELAQHMLRDTDLSVSDVAATLGYSDVAVFSRAFRAWMSMSPGQWRKSLAPGGELGTTGT